VLTPILEKIDKKFLFYLTTNQNFIKYLVANEKGATYPAVTPDIFHRANIKLPPIVSQQKIAAILSAYDDLIENNLKRIKLLEEMAQITYEEWFVRLKFPGHETTPIDSETGLSEGWSEAEIPAISFINANSIKTKNVPETIKYIDIASTDTGFTKNQRL
jgi:type I restriction enzyme, S subunit